MKSDRWDSCVKKDVRSASACEAYRRMPEELGEARPEIGRHGRLSADYAQASLSLDASSLSLDEDHAPPVTAAGRLGTDYLRAVAELVNNPTAMFRVVVDERFDSAAPGWPNDPRAGARLV